MNDEATSNTDRNDNTTDFGFTRVDREAKAGMVRGVFADRPFWISLAAPAISPPDSLVWSDPRAR